MTTHQSANVFLRPFLAPILFIIQFTWAGQICSTCPYIHTCKAYRYNIPVHAYLITLPRHHPINSLYVSPVSLLFSVRAADFLFLAFFLFTDDTVVSLITPARSLACFPVQRSSILCLQRGSSCCQPVCNSLGPGGNPSQRTKLWWNEQNNVGNARFFKDKDRFYN